MGNVLRRVGGSPALAGDSLPKQVLAGRRSLRRRRCRRVGTARGGVRHAAAQFADLRAQRVTFAEPADDRFRSAARFFVVLAGRCDAGFGRVAEFGLFFRLLLLCVTRAGLERVQLRQTLARVEAAIGGTKRARGVCIAEQFDDPITERTLLVFCQV